MKNWIHYPDSPLLQPEGSFYYWAAHLRPNWCSDYLKAHCYFPTSKCLPIQTQNNFKKGRSTNFRIHFASSSYYEVPSPDPIGLLVISFSRHVILHGFGLNLHQLTSWPTVAKILCLLPCHRGCPKVQASQSYVFDPSSWTGDLLGWIKLFPPFLIIIPCILFRCLRAQRFGAVTQVMSFWGPGKQTPGWKLLKFF